MKYDIQPVSAPEWMRGFACLARDCPETCCQNWNVDVDPEHAALLRGIDDPQIKPVMDGLLKTFRVRRGGKQTEEVHRLMLLNQPGRRCPFLNEFTECRLQRTYGAEILCLTCYFHPRAFWQIDESYSLSACLSCYECARLALTHPAPTVFSRFEAEIDPQAEWLETEMIADEGTRDLLRHRDEILGGVIAILQNRALPLDERVRAAADSLMPGLSRTYADEAEHMRLLTEMIAPVNHALEKPALAAEALLWNIAGGAENRFRVLGRNYQAGQRLYREFLGTHAYMEENFLVHFVFSDSLKEFVRYQTEPVTADAVRRHEAALILVWHELLRAVMGQAALANGEMTESLFLDTAVHADRDLWHYPAWGGRAAERLAGLRGG